MSPPREIPSNLQLGREGVLWVGEGEGIKFKPPLESDARALVKVLVACVGGEGWGQGVGRGSH